MRPCEGDGKGRGCCRKKTGRRETYRNPRRSLTEKTKGLVRAIEENSFFRTIPHRSLLKSVLAVDLPDSNVVKSMTGRTLARATTACLSHFLQAASFTRNIILLIDDVGSSMQIDIGIPFRPNVRAQLTILVTTCSQQVQWMDEESFQLLESLFDVPGIAVVISSRHDGPVERAYTTFVSRATKLKLQPFLDEEAKTFILQKYGLDAVDDAITKFVVGRTGGSPMTLERLLRSLIDNEIFAITDERHLVLNESKVNSIAHLEEIETPDSVRALIRAQLAQLNPRSLELLFLASTIGRHFSFGLLEDSFGARDQKSRSSRMAAVLQALVKGGILGIEGQTGMERSRREKMVFYFVSSVTQHAVYEMQAPEGFAANHLAVAQALEASLVSGSFSSMDRPHGKVRRGSIASVAVRVSNEKEILPKIALHLERAGKKLRAVDFYFRAGSALSSQGLVSAGRMFHKCLALSKSLGDSVSGFMRARYSLAAAKELVYSGRFEEAVPIALSALEIMGEGAITPSAWNIGVELCSLWMRETCFDSLATVSAEDEQDQVLKLHLYTVLVHAAAGGKRKDLAVYSTLRGTRIGSTLKTSRAIMEADPDVLEAVAALDAALGMAALIGGYPSFAERAVARSISSAPAGTLRAAWRLYLFQANGLLALGMFTPLKAILDHSVEEATQMRNMTYLLGLGTCKVVHGALTLCLGDASTIVAKLMSIHRHEVNVGSKFSQCT